ncbi:hypothetical protein DH2020_021835 [Rehmannia glutinosa]|uniref:Nuclear pore complex protein NUP214 n=1 Tax=Rehmannia glutinosa TaxID=99300 RepID=A0ABR0WFU3_REHGL
MGQNPLVNSQAVKVDEPEKSLSIVLNQDSNAENQSSEVKHSTGFFSGKVVSDFSRQPITKDPLSGCSVEPSSKVPPTNSPSLWSLTRSSARVDASKTSDGRFSSLPSDAVDDSEKHALQSGGHVLRHSTDIKEKAKPSIFSTSFGQTASTAQGHRNSVPAYPGSQLPLGESVASGKSFQSEFKKEFNSASSPTGLPYSLQNASKQFGNVEEMAKKLDNLLEGIEGKGGFIDASITSQTKSVIELEDNIWALSSRCRRWRNAVSVLVRKEYMEGIFKQAKDSRYWELLNRQKLSSELELKRRRIVELNQDLTTKLIELERHFNSLEFNNFGENGGMQRNRRVLQNFHGHSRQTQSLHSLHNTMQAQLAAAEQLSGCLSNQMAALSINSSEKHDVKKQLFESIGLSYTVDTERSPARNRTLGTPSNKELLITPGSTSAKEQSRRNQASFAKSYEPETARRRRDSLDLSWASFEPPKTTVKRVPKENYEKGTANRSLLSIDKQYLSPQSQKNSEVAHSALSNISRASWNSYKSKGNAEIPGQEYTESPSTSLHQRTAGSLDNGTQVLSTKKKFALPSPSAMETRTTHNSEQAAFKLIDEKSKSKILFTGKKDSFAGSESNFVQQSQLPEQSLTSPSDSTESLDHFKIGFTKSTTWDQKKNTRIVSETPLFGSKIPVNPASALSSGTDVLEKGAFTKSSEKPSWPNNSLAASIPSQSVFGSSSLSSKNVPSFASSVSKPSLSTSFPETPSSGAIVAAKPEVSQPQTSIPSALNFASTSPSPSSSIIKSESLTSSSHPPVAIYGSKTESVSPPQTSVDNTSSNTEKDVKIQASATEPGFTISTFDLKPGPSASSEPTESSTNSKFGRQIDSGGLSNSSSDATSVIKTELPSATEALSPIALSSEGIIGSVKNIVSNSSHEEEMEEEAPETDQTTEFSLGNLGGFGIGSTPPNSTTPKSNPFGVATLNKNTTFASSPNMMSASSGELFRPASFNFQPPQPPAPLQPTTVNFSGGFSSGNSGQASAVSGFGQPAHIGGAGQQALGSVLGSFGQSRQLGAGLPGSNVAPASGFGSGFRGISPGGFGGGFASASSGGGGFGSLAAGGGGFAAAATAGGGFAAAATAGGGFAAAATAGGGFAAAATAGGGFAAAAAPIVGGGFASSATGGSMSGGGFGGFSNQQGGGGGFSAFGGGSGGGRPPSELFTQMRK